MTWTDKIEEFVALLCEAYEKTLPETREGMYKKILSEELEGCSLSKLLRDIVKTCQFFPTVAEIIRVAGRSPATAKDQAENLVDRAIHLFTTNPKAAYEELGSENVAMLKRAGLDPYGLRTGMQDPRFHRTAWVRSLGTMISAKLDPQLTAISVGQAKEALRQIENKFEKNKK